MVVVIAMTGFAALASFLVVISHVWPSPSSRRVCRLHFARLVLCGRGPSLSRGGAVLPTRNSRPMPG
eukprot:7641899-Pyramimonas_sp.AAC.1